MILYPEKKLIGVVEEMDADPFTGQLTDDLSTGDTPNHPYPEKSTEISWSRNGDQRISSPPLLELNTPPSSVVKLKKILPFVIWIFDLVLTHKVTTCAPATPILI